MRALAFFAFFALQLSVFTCEFDIHLHTMDSSIGHIAEHQHGDNNQHKQQDSVSHACHVHASHTFVVSIVEQQSKELLASTANYILAGIYMKTLHFLIEHPPK